MHQSVYHYLDTHGIQFKEHKHQAFFTVAETNASGIEFPFTHTKNLFLTDGQGHFFLFCLQAEKKAPLKQIKSLLQVKELRFASPEDLFEQLNLRPGSVSIFGLINNKDVVLILDQEIHDAESVGFHPNINTATLELDHENFMKFYDSIPNRKEVVEIA